MGVLMGIVVNVLAVGLAWHTKHMVWLVAVSVVSAASFALFLSSADAWFEHRFRKLRGLSFVLVSASIFVSVIWLGFMYF